LVVRVSEWRRCDDVAEMQTRRGGRRVEKVERLVWMVGGGSEIGAGRSQRVKTGQRLGPSDWAGKSGVQLKRRETEWEEREQHDRSRVLMAESAVREPICAAAWRRNGGEGSRREGARVELESGVETSREEVEVASVRMTVVWLARLLGRVSEW
jgi:hypothetical protein